MTSNGYASDDDRQPQYPGEDIRSTSKKELIGWYSYGWAAEVFAVCGVGSFLPITLEQLAREWGVLAHDHAARCDVDSNSLNHTAIEEAAHLFRRIDTANPQAMQCVVRILGIWVNTASFAMYTFSISVFLQALVIVSMSGAADHGRYRKKLLLVFACVGSVATMLFLPVGPDAYVLGALLAIVANVCFGASFVLLNSFLPVLVRHHPSLQESEANKSHASPYEARSTIEAEEWEDPADSTAALLSASRLPTTNINPPAQISPALQLSTKISSRGIGIGFMAAVLFQVMSIGILLGTGSTTFSLSLVLFLIGLWWAVFTVPAALYLRPRPGPPLPDAHPRAKLAYIGHSWRTLFTTIHRARRLRDVMLFLFAWFLLSDALATVSTTAILFAKTELGMKKAALALISVIVTLFGVLGAFTWSSIARRFRWTATQTICVCIAIFEVVLLYGLLGLVPAVRRMGMFGLQQEWEMYVLGAVYGLVLGGVGSYCRALFGELVPPGSEAAFYALYAITDKGSSVFGPAIVGAITDRWGGIRPTFVFLVILVGLPGPILAFVDVERGKREARKLADGVEHGEER